MTKTFSAYMQPVGSPYQYELEIRYGEQRYLIRRQGKVVGERRAGNGSHLTVQQLFDMARAAVTSGRGITPEQDV